MTILDYDEIVAGLGTGKNTLYLPHGMGQARWFPGDARFDYVVSEEAFQGYRLAAEQSSTPAMPPPANLAVIASVLPAFFDLTPDGNWDGSSREEFGIGGAFFGDFDINDNTPFKVGWNDLLTLVRTPLPTTTELSATSCPVHNLRQEPVLRLTHRFVVPKEEIIRDDNSYSPIHDGVVEVATDIQINQWPALTIHAKKELELRQGTHTIIPLPAYDVEGFPIAPENYQRELEGAIVWVEFNLEHSLNISADHIFEAPIRRLRMIRPGFARTMPVPRMTLKERDDGDLL